MKTTRVIGKLLLLLATAELASSAYAHVMPANKGTVSIKEQNAYVVISVPVSALSNFDDNRDGLMDTTELGRHSDTLRAQVDSRLELQADGQKPIERVTFIVSALTGEDEIVPMDYVVVMSAQRFNISPETIEIWTDLFGDAEKDQRIALTAALGPSQEAAVLTPDHPRHSFFRGGFTGFADSLWLGATHILTGYDHLLFLLTAIAGAMSARRWIIILSGFTVAHSITLVAASLDLVSVSPEIVEPFIAASIVALALDNLLGGTHRPFALRTTIVFACGLLHGLGFASVWSSFGLTGANLLPNLLGFNIGVEVGQFIFVGAVLAAFRSATYFAPRAFARERVMITASILAAVPGLSILAMRIMPIA